MEHKTSARPTMLATYTHTQHLDYFSASCVVIFLNGGCIITYNLNLKYHKFWKYSAIFSPTGYALRQGSGTYGS